MFKVLFVNFQALLNSIFGLEHEALLPTLFLIQAYVETTILKML